MISNHILNLKRYPFISFHILTYPKISSGANSQMDLESRSSRGGSCGDGEGCSRAAGGGLPQEERQDRAAEPACAHASHAGAGPGPASTGRNLNPGHHPSPQGLRPNGPRTAGVEETYMARRGFGTESHDPQGSAVGKDSDEALHHTIQMMPFAGKSNPAAVA